jgi:hypothetical protein
MTGFRDGLTVWLRRGAGSSTGCQGRPRHRQAHTPASVFTGTAPERLPVWAGERVVHLETTQVGWALSPGAMHAEFADAAGHGFPHARTRPTLVYCPRMSIGEPQRPAVSLPNSPTDWAWEPNAWT